MRLLVTRRRSQSEVISRPTQMLCDGPKRRVAELALAKLGKPKGKKVALFDLALSRILMSAGSPPVTASRCSGLPHRHISNVLSFRHTEHLEDEAFSV